MADVLHLLPIKELKMPSATCKGRSGRVLALGVMLVVARISVGAGNDSSEARMRHDIDFLASDQCEGRGVNTAGINPAAPYSANEVQKARLKPAEAAGSYFQPFTTPPSQPKAAPRHVCH